MHQLDDTVGRADPDEPDRCPFEGEHGHLRLEHEFSHQVDPPPQLATEHRVLVGEMDPRRRDPGGELCGLDRTREGERPSAQDDLLHAFGVWRGDDTAAGSERLGQTGGHDHPGVPVDAIEHDTAPGRSGPAEPVGVVEVDVEIAVAIEQIDDVLHRGGVAEHRVDAIGQVPQPPLDVAMPLDGLDEGVHVVVRHRHDLGSARSDDLQGEVDRCMRLGVDDGHILGADEHGQGRQVAEGRGCGDSDRSAHHLSESLAELLVQRQRRVRGRR